MLTRSLILVALSLGAVGCTCQQKMTFRKAWRGHVMKAYNWVLADNEASKYRDREAAAREALRQYRLETSPYVVANRLRAEGFSWHAESLDFTSYPWVTIARKRGDCDDFMLLWEATLKYKDGRTRRVTVTSKDGGGHAMLLWYEGEPPLHLWLLSNLRVLARGSPGDEDDLVRRFYGDRTDCWIDY